MSLFDCDIDELKSVAGTSEMITTNEDKSFSCIFRFVTELKIPITPDDEFRSKRTPEAIRIYAKINDEWKVAGHVSLDAWPVPNTARATVTCILPDPVQPKMQATWSN